MGGPASLQSGWKSLSQQTPEVKDTDITLLKVEHTPVSTFTQEKLWRNFDWNQQLRQRRSGPERHVRQHSQPIGRAGLIG